MPEEPAPRHLLTEGDPAPSPAGARPALAGRNLLAGFLRPTWSQLVMALVLCLVGTAVVVQVRARSHADSYSTMRRTDLVQLMDQLDAEQGRLNQEATRLERTREQLASGADARRVAAAENQKRLQSLGILNGTLPATGAGIRLTIVDPQQRVTPEVLLDAVEEMRDAGAEAIEIDDRVRVVGSTWFGGEPGRLQADGQSVAAPIVIDVIGEPHALEEGARFRGGLVSQVQAADVGGQVLISRLEQVQVTSLHEVRPARWAKPA